MDIPDHASKWVLNGELPKIAIRYPVCGHCDSDLYIDSDTASCENCQITWGTISESADASPMDPDKGVCGEKYSHHNPAFPQHETVNNHYVYGPFQSCVLPVGHSSEHLHPYEMFHWRSDNKNG